MEFRIVFNKIINQIGTFIETKIEVFQKVGLHGHHRNSDEQQLTDGKLSHHQRTAYIESPEGLSGDFSFNRQCGFETCEHQGWVSATENVDNDAFESNERCKRSTETYGTSCTRKS